MMTLGDTAVCFALGKDELTRRYEAIRLIGPTVSFFLSPSLSYFFNFVFFCSVVSTESVSHVLASTCSSKNKNKFRRATN